MSRRPREGGRRPGWEKTPVQDPGVQAYRRQQLESMKPEQLVLAVFEQGILACRKRDPRRARGVVQQLIGALDFQYGEMVGGLLALYDWVQRLIREGRFDEAGDILEELRATWAAAADKESARSEAESAAPDERLPPGLAG